LEFVEAEPAVERLKHAPLRNDCRITDGCLRSGKLDPDDQMVIIQPDEPH
jgi:hypothetical protein